MKNIGFAVCIITAFTLASCGIVKNTTNNVDDVYSVGGDFKHIQQDQVAREQKSMQRDQDKQAAVYAAQTNSRNTINSAANTNIAGTSPINQTSPCGCNNIYPGYSTYGFNNGYGYATNYNMMGYGYNTGGMGYMGSNYYSPYSYGYNNYYMPQTNYYNNTATNNNGNGYTETINKSTIPQHRGTGIGSSTPGQNSGVSASFDKPQVAAQTINTAPAGNVQVHTRSTYNNPQTSYTPTPQNNQSTPQAHASTQSGSQSYSTPIPQAAQQTHTYTPQATQQSYTPVPQPVSNQQTYHQRSSYSTPSYSAPSATPTYSSPSSFPSSRPSSGGFGGATPSIGGGGASHSGGGGRHR